MIRRALPPPHLGARRSPSLAAELGVRRGRLGALAAGALPFDSAELELHRCLGSRRPAAGLDAGATL